MKEKEKIQLYDDVLDADEVEGTDVQINPDVYLHNALLKAQKALIKDNMQEGLLQFRLLVEHVEVITRASKMLEIEYKMELEEYLKSKEYKEESKENIKSVRLANKKLELILKEVFSRKVQITPIKM